MRQGNEPWFRQRFMSNRHKIFMAGAAKIVGVIWITGGVFMFLVTAGEIHSWWDLPTSLLPLLVAGLGALVILAKPESSPRVPKPAEKAPGVKPSTSIKSV
jgi:hypothetical protein